MKVEHKRANKDYPDQGIKKGEMYYSWSFFRGPTRRSKSYPKRSQLTSSSFLSAVYDAEDAVADAKTELESAVAEAEKGNKSWKEIGELIGDLETACTDAASEVESAGDEAQGSYDNMPEGLQQGDTGQLLEQRAENAIRIKDELENAASDINSHVDTIVSENEDGSPLTKEQIEENVREADEAAAAVDNIDWNVD